MTSIVPPLDTIDFDRLVESARGNIPRYAPEWTDHNLHDPGMTLIDLLAWIVDQQIYRVGLVGDRHLKAFAALLGQRPRGPAAATGLVWPDGPIPNARSVVAGEDVVYLAKQDLSFVLEHAVFLTEANVRGSWLSSDGIEVRVSDEVRRPGSVPLAPRAKGATAELIVRLDGPLVVGNRFEPIAVGFEVVPPPGPPPTSNTSWGPLTFDYRIGTGDRFELRVLHDGTAGLARTGAVILDVPGGSEADSAELRMSLTNGFFPVAPQLRHVAVNVLPIVQREIVAGARLADGNGLPDQTVTIDSRGLLVGDDVPPFTITVGDETWIEQADFTGSKPRDPHFVRAPDHLLFGNGINGNRPQLRAEIRNRDFARTDGAAGNVRAGSTWRVPALGRLVDVFGRNHVALSGGADGSTLDDLLAAARAAATERAVLLTDEDLETAAFELPGLAVARAEVVSGFNPAIPDRRLDGVRTLVVIPHRQAEIEFDGVAEAYVDTVRAALNQDRVLGERLIVTGPRAALIDVEIESTVESGAVAADVEVEIEAALRHRLSDIGRDDGTEPWPLGRPVTVEELKTIVANVPGVVTVPRCRIARAGAPLQTETIEIQRDSVAIAAAVSLQITSDGPARSGS